MQISSVLSHIELPASEWDVLFVESKGSRTLVVALELDCSIREKADEDMHCGRAKERLEYIHVEAVEAISNVDFNDWCTRRPSPREVKGVTVCESYEDVYVVKHDVCSGRMDKVMAVHSMRRLS